MTLFTVLQLIVSLLLVVVVILQTRGSEMGMSFGGGGESYRSKRGIEKILFYATVVLAAIFALLSILALINR